MLRSSRLACVSGLLLCALLGVGCGEPLNTPPKGIRGPLARVAEAVPGQVVQLEVEVVDEEGDPLTYQWSQALPASPQGTFSDAAIGSPTWTAPEVSEDTDFFLELLVSDDHDNVIQGELIIRVRKPTSSGQVPEAAGRR